MSIKSPLFIAFLLLAAKVGMAQEAFNRHMAHRVSAGVSITSFSANVNYLVIPGYGFRLGKHVVGLDGFYGRLDNLPERTDWGIGLVYKAFPFKNKTWTRPFAETGFYYHCGSDSRYKVEGLFWRLGGGIEAALTDVIHIDIGVNFGLTAPVGSSPATGVDSLSVVNPALQVFFMPVIRATFELGPKPMKK